MPSCLIGLLVLLCVIVFLMIIGGFFYNKTEGYKSWKAELSNMQLNSEIGKPNGVLKIRKQQDCEADQNQLIQSNVAFKPHRVGKSGCTYVDTEWA